MSVHWSLDDPGHKFMVSSHCLLVITIHLTYPCITITIISSKIPPPRTQTGISMFRPSLGLEPVMNRDLQRFFPRPHSQLCIGQYVGPWFASDVGTKLVYFATLTLSIPMK